MSYLSMYRGDDRVLDITASETLTGSTLRFTAKQRRTDTEAVIEKSTGDGITIGSPATTASIAIDAADTEDLEPTVLFWDIEVTDVTGKVHTVATGRLEIHADVTRPVDA
jgi:hypothetical protein